MPFGKKKLLREKLFPLREKKQITPAIKNSANLVLPVHLKDSDAPFLLPSSHQLMTTDWPTELSDLPCQVYETGNGVVSNYYDGRVARSKNGGVFYTQLPSDYRYPLKHYPFDVQNNGSQYLQYGNRYYLRYLRGSSPQYMDRVSKALGSDFVPPNWYFTAILMSNKDTHTNLHRDGMDGVMLQLKGKKKWYIWDPKHTQQLDFRGERSARFHDRISSKMIQNKRMPPCREVVVGPGEAIFIQAGHPHYVETLTDGAVSLGFRYFGS